MTTRRIVSTVLCCWAWGCVDELAQVNRLGFDGSLDTGAVDGAVGRQDVGTGPVDGAVGGDSAVLDARPPVDGMTATDAEIEADMGIDPDQGSEPDAMAPDMDPVDPEELYADCRDELRSAPDWAAADQTLALAGGFEFGQTHVVGADEMRIAPRLIAERETLVLFSPDRPLQADAPLLLAARRDGDLLGVIEMAPPDDGVGLLESALTAIPLAPYSQTAWSTVLPWSWVVDGLEIEAGYITRDPDGSTRYSNVHRLPDLGAPHRFTISRARMVLFGEPDKATDTQPAARIAKDFFATLPHAELRWIDSSPWRLDEIVVPTENGPRLVVSEAQRRMLTNDENHWSIIKHQFALRLSLANTGRGLFLTRPPEGDNSPYSFGTSVGMGWYRDPLGNYRDIDDAGLAAGWTGWTAMWVNECGNGFIHEVGHSCTLAHFTEGTAARWDIADEYPRDGTNLESHPWGYDSTRRQMRTWYRVGRDGVVLDGNGDIQGKRDPMNGGEAPNDVTCFPQYTAYHARKIQRWSQNSPTIASVGGAPGIYRWGADGYDPEEPAAHHQRPAAVDVPVYTIIGSLGAAPEANRTYPPIHWPQGNLFQWPDPFGDDLDGPFLGAQYFLEVEYADGERDFALIARAQVRDNQMFEYSLNVDARRNPFRIHLHLSRAAYPDIARDQSEVLHTAEFGAPERHDPVLRVGRGFLANDGLRLSNWCERGLNCARRMGISTWRPAGSQLFFTGSGADLAAATGCGALGEISEWTVPVVDQDGAEHRVVIHGQRVISTPGETLGTAVTDATPWLGVANNQQSLRAWIPYGANADLPPGRYRTVEPAPGLEAHLRRVDGRLESLGSVPVRVDLEVLDAIFVDLNREYRSPPLLTEESSFYFLVRDPRMGPTQRVWWNDNEAGPTRLTAPMVDQVTDEVATVVIRAQRETCNGELLDLNVGRVDRNCEHRVILWVEPDNNPDLVEGRTYRSSPTDLLVLDGRRWHEPNAEALVGTFAFELQYTHGGVP
jgi:hypothetical protein